MATKIKYVAVVVKWFDKVNGNTYHSVKITRCMDGKQIVAPFQYGYGSQYEQSTHEAMTKAKWLPVKYRKDSSINKFLMDNNYPIMFVHSQGTKSECVANGKEY